MDKNIGDFFIVRRLIHCAICKKQIMAFVPNDTFDYLCEECEVENGEGQDDWEDDLFGSRCP